MAISVPASFLKKHGRQLGDVQPKKRTSVYDEIKKISVDNSPLVARNDSVHICEKDQSLTLILDGAMTVAHNKILRVKYQALGDYNDSWYARIARLVEKNQTAINKWKNSLKDGQRLILESVEASNRKAKDNDSSSGSFKPIVDGLVNASLVKDDSPDLLFILPPLPMKDKSPKIILRLKPSPSRSQFYSKDLYNLACS